MPVYNKKTKEWMMNDFPDTESDGHGGYNHPDSCTGYLTTNAYRRDRVKAPSKELNPLTVSHVRRFVLQRDEDESGVSGTGVVAEGVEFTTGWCALSWLTNAHSIGIYANVKELERIHGHNGRAYVKWVDDND